MNAQVIMKFLKKTSFNLLEKIGHCSSVRYRFRLVNVELSFDPVTRKCFVPTSLSGWFVAIHPPTLRPDFGNGNEPYRRVVQEIMTGIADFTDNSTRSFL
mgnify:CR=1 FL=1